MPAHHLPLAKPERILPPAPMDLSMAIPSTHTGHSTPMPGMDDAPINTVDITGRDFKQVKLVKFEPFDLVIFSPPGLPD